MRQDHSLPAGDRAAFDRCAEWLAAADGLLITAGAGIGVDSGLPDFRGSEGFWRAYPALARSAIAFEEIASPATFAADPALAWGFYGHRLNLYRGTTPHAGFRLLLDIATQLPQGAFVATSNVDGQFQKAGFDAARVFECHGSIHWLQCTQGCDDRVWPADALAPIVDETRCRLQSPLPRCPRCGEVVRPNILMFNDWNWLEQRSAAQNERLRQWRRGVDRLLVIEIGAGTNIATIRHLGEQQGGALIRINPRAPALRPGTQGISLDSGALTALQGIAAAFAGRRTALVPPVNASDSGRL